MKETPDQILPAENTPNFHEISENRRELRKTIKDLDASLTGKKSNLEDKNKRKELSGKLSRFEKVAKGFKVSEHGGLEGSVNFLKKQKNKTKGELLPIDLEAIYEQFPEYRDIEETESYIRYLKDKRMKETFALKGAKTNGDEQKYSMHLNMTEGMLEETEAELEEFPALDLRAGELVGYKQNLSESGHICITPSTEENLEEIGKKMLSGKPVFLHGPTGTGKTTLAEYAAKHFTGKDAEMVYCSPQTKESNIWGRTGVKAEGGVPITEFIYGPLAKALRDGRVIIFDEFTDLPKEQVSFLKGVFSKKVGDTISVQGNGDVIIAEGFQMIFTSNLKSKKNLEKSELPPQMADEFTQNNIEINYTPKNEAYDIMLARLLNRDGTLDMSYYDVNTTLKSLCESMEEIQSSYVGETDPERAKKLGEVSANNKFHSFEKFVMTQRSIEAILSLWDIEKLRKDKKTFAEFIDDRLMTALNFKEFSEKDRILAAKIFASRGFLTGVKAEDLSVPDSQSILRLNTKRAGGVEDAVEELQKESGAVKHLTLKEVAELDPFGKRAEILKGQAEALLGDENAEKGDDFSKKLKKKLKGKGKNNQEDLDSEALKTEFTPFLEETWKKWGLDADKIKSAVISPIITDPKVEDYPTRQADTDASKFGEFTLNPDTQNLDWETLKDKIFIPDLSTLEGKPLSEVAKYLVDNYADKYQLPGIEYWKFMLENPDKVPTDPKGVNLKDGKYYFNFGSLVRSSDGYWRVPCAGWDGSGWDRHAPWLSNKWYVSYRVVLLEI
jgi:MoxR-like ATPase